MDNYENMRSTWYATYVCNVKSISMTVDKSEVCNLCISESSRERQDGVEGRAGQGRADLFYYAELSKREPQICTSMNSTSFK